MLSTDGTILASCSDDQTIRLWNVRTGEEKKILKGHKGTVNSICFSPDSKILASGGDDTSVFIWDAKTS